MALQPCYECNKEISTKALMCPQCGAPQNPVSGLADKTKGFFSKRKEEKEARKAKERDLQERESEWNRGSPEVRKTLRELVREEDVKGSPMSKEERSSAVTMRTREGHLIHGITDSYMTEKEERFYKILDYEDRNDFDFDGTSPSSSLKKLEEHNRKKYL
jgi:NMD protein affecting ribosome stability and mRNA decay